MELRFSVVITTFNRSTLVRRAIESVMVQRYYEDVEIIVVDDASTDNTQTVVQKQYPNVTYLRNTHNQGPGVARNIGILHASNPFVLILDDDDTLLRDAFVKIKRCLQGLGVGEWHEYPVFQFSTSNGYLNESFRIVQLDDYILGNIRGDFTPVIQRDLFINSGLSYPTLKIGAEHLLWWDVAERYGIPTWKNVVTEVHDDAPVRLTSVNQQVLRATEHAEAQELTLSKFGPFLITRYPQYYAKKAFGAAAYWLLAGRRDRAKESLRYLKTKTWSEFFIKMCLWVLTFLPKEITNILLRLYRRGVNAR